MENLSKTLVGFAQTLKSILEAHHRHHSLIAEVVVTKLDVAISGALDLFRRGISSEAKGAVNCGCFNIVYPLETFMHI